MPPASPEPSMLPLFYIEKGRVVLPGEKGWVYARDSEGSLLDPFDVSDYLTEKYHRIYLLDVDGLKSNNPQLDYLQELSRNREVWAETGPRDAEQVIDVLVAGATRAVLSLDLLQDPEQEISHTLSLTSEVALLVNTDEDGVLSHDRQIREMSVDEVCRTATEWGVSILILPNANLGWETVSHLASRSTVYVKGIHPEEAESLRASRAAGGILEVPYHE